MNDKQIPIFGFKDMRPRVKVPISEARVREGKALYDQGRFSDSAKVMREIRYGLENFCKRINQKP